MHHILYQIEAELYSDGALTGGNIKLHNVIPSHLEALIAKLSGDGRQFLP